MREQDSMSVPLRSLTTRRLEVHDEPSSLVAPIWDPAAQLQPMVMVIDDSLAVRRVVEICLGRQGISTASFANGIDAMSALSRGKIAPPKVLLLDVGMPKMNGYDVARRLKSNPAFRDIRLFMLTGHDGMLDRAYARLLGAGFIPKPFKSQELIRIVSDALDMGIADARWR
jgi:twitching motility two-component system response regulator PilG